MRTLNIGVHRFTEAYAMDEPGEGGACHRYGLTRVGDERKDAIAFGFVKFQKGPVKEHGVNGCFMEDLIAICIDRLRAFQEGEFKCEENRNALYGLEQAIEWLDIRTQDRRERGVEGVREK